MCINRGMDKVDVVCIYIYTHSGILPGHKKEWDSAICRGVDGSCHTEQSKSEREKYHVLTYSCGIQKNGIADLICKTDTDAENNHIDTKGAKGDGMNWEIGTDIYTPLILCIKQITNENLSRAGNSTQCFVVT